jgi:hypothetical protein
MFLRVVRRKRTAFTSIAPILPVLVILMAAGAVGLYGNAFPQSDSSASQIQQDPQALTQITTVVTQTRVAYINFTTRITITTVRSTITSTRTFNNPGDSLLVQVEAPSITTPGATLQIGALVSWRTNGSLAWANFYTCHYRTPGGALVTFSGSPAATLAVVHKGFYTWTMQLPSDSATGVYMIHVWVNNNGLQGQGFGEFTVVKGS